ncbi:MAG: ABC transporter ATP-binding protein [Aquificae bacterium]|nr:ABC transporter ATP-binding protein [Aquificota bacterium]
MAVVKLERVSKVYPDGTQALRGVNLEVKEGEFLGVMGPSGSGKSTLLHIMGGLDAPTEGRCLLMGKDLSKMSEDELAEFRRRRVAFVFQFYYLLEDFTVLENMLVAARIAGVPDAFTKAKKLLKFLRLEHRADHKPAQLSGGEQQRAAIGRALITEPKLLLADEPTGNLDSKETRRIFELFKRLNEEGLTLVVATHDESLAPYFNRVVRLRDGEVEGIYLSK